MWPSVGGKASYYLSETCPQKGVLGLEGLGVWGLGSGVRSFGWGCGAAAMLSVSAKCNKLQMKSKLIFNKATQMFGPHSGRRNSAGACPGCLGMSFSPALVCVGILGKMSGCVPNLQPPLKWKGSGNALYIWQNLAYYLKYMYSLIFNLHNLNSFCESKKRIIFISLYLHTYLYFL